ncbi:MAG TPA: RHS repeat-associated core domain-containing protein, partial [Myxococcaceae bacterium]|nr:RHS repeat-associated core domain-containing protein [Myxococcaceae bacterium]
SRSWLGYQGQEWDADLGVHDFGARLYDPTLRRFLAPDPARQFSSPYVFLGGNPLQNVDPSGQASAASIAVGATTVAIAAVTVAGLALSVFTFGVSDAAAASVDAALMSTEALEVGADLGADLGEVVLEESLEEGLEETTDLLLEDTEETLSTSSEGSAESAPTGSEGARELEAGPETGGSGKSAAKASTEVGSATRSPANKVLRKLGSEALKGGSRSALRSGIAYNVQGIRGDDWSMKGLLASLGKGFGAGAIYGLTCGAMELGLERVIPGASSFNKVGKACISAAASTMANVACNDVNQMVTNVINGDPFYSQLGRATVGGTVSGVASWAACEAITATIGAPAAYTTAVAVTVVTTGAVPNQTDSSTSMSGS